MTTEISSIFVYFYLIKSKAELITFHIKSFQLIYILIFFQICRPLIDWFVFLWFQLPIVVKHLHQHLLLFLPVCGDIINHTVSVIQSSDVSDDVMDQIEGLFVLFLLIHSYIIFFNSFGGMAVFVSFKVLKDLDS